MGAIEILKDYFDKIKLGCDTPTKFDFGAKLIQSNTADFLDFHYSILAEADTEKKLYDFIARKFKDRHSSGEDYLLTRIKSEQDNVVKATVLQILGSFKYSKINRATETADLARKFLTSESDTLRCRALWVIGWTGNVNDIEQISTLLFNDTNNENRCWAGTAMMQISFNDKISIEKSLPYLKVAIAKETDIKALEGILVSIQEITGKKLGLSPSSHDPPNEEKVAKALKKATKMLA
ncbi:HEAT repeat domain-containing protein [Pedobacter polaris]|uniref:HEAT repeat domain-containing protein n=1 Tax=Pedobacter polaris TaxID=2571273 RepID=A0A4V5NZC9_9SPHI|nr:HEAT repeat domain-containing protein [Pedobacter polaris]TKC08055.1 HEAT repeat domain-containing protein [Pedobacter polaris]